LRHSGEPFVTDFGLAKFIDGKDDDHTRSIAMLGTPHYMSPEQCQGGSENVTTASDVYALGVILYEMLAGKPPFKGDTTLEVIRKIAEDEPPQFNGFDVPRDLETIYRKCLEKEPLRRYSSALALAEDLERLERGEPVLARPIHAYERAYRWCKRNKALAGLGAAATLAVLLGLFGFTKSREEAAQRSLTQAFNYAHMMNQAWRSYDAWDLQEARDYLSRTRPKPSEKDRRDWEWRYLWALLKDNADVRLGPIGSQDSDEDSRISAVAFTSDRQSVIVASNRGAQVEVWHVGDRQRTQLLDLRPRERRVLALCPRRQWVAVRTPSDDRFQAVEILRIDDGVMVHQWPLGEGGDRPVMADFSASGRYLAVGGKKQGSWVLDSETGKTAFSVPSSKKSVRTFGTFVSLSQDGALLTLANAATGVRVIRWQEETNRIVFSDANERLYATAEYYYLACSPDNHWLALSAGAHAHPVWLIDLTNGTRKQLHSTSRRALRQIEKQVRGGAPRPPSGSRPGGQIQFSPDSASLLLTGGSDIEVFDIATRQSHIIRNAYGGRKGAFSPDGNLFVTTGEPYMFIYRSDTAYTFQSLKFGPIRTGLAGLGDFSTDGRKLAVTFGTPDPEQGGSVHLIDTITHQDTEIEALGKFCVRPRFLPGNRLVVGSSGSLVVYHIDTEESKNVSVECPIPDVEARPFPLAVIKKLNVLAVGFKIQSEDFRRPYVLMDLDRWEVVKTGAGQWSFPVNFTADERYVICPSPKGDQAPCPIREVELSATLLDGDPADDHYQADIVYDGSGGVLGLWDGEIWDALAGKVIYNQSNSPHPNRGRSVFPPWRSPLAC
jgi:WD40 repeat protein